MDICRLTSFVSNEAQSCLLPAACRAVSRFVVVAAIAISLSSCIGLSWDNSGVEPVRAGEMAGRIKLYIPEYLTEGPSYSNHFPLPPPHIVHSALRQSFEQRNENNKFIVTKTPPEAGAFCSIRLEETDRSSMAEAWNLLSIFTVWLVPYYDNSLGYNVIYEAYVGAKLMKRYQYKVRGKQLQWAAALLAVPFLDGRWHFPLEPNATVDEDLLLTLWQTSNSFLEDARKDGSLK